MLPIILFTIALALAIFYFIGRYNKAYWTKRGVFFHEENKVLGPFWDFLVKDEALFSLLGDIYHRYPEKPVVALGSFLSPTLYVRDVQNLHHVMQVDSRAFNHRDIDINNDDHLGENLLFLTGQKWKLVRQNMTPLFTAAKLRKMFYIIEKSAVDFVDLLKNDPEKQRGNAFITLTNLCSAAVGAAVFGISTNSIFDSPFHGVARRAFSDSIDNNLKFALAHISKPLFKLFNIKFFKEYEKFFIGAIREVIEQRKKDGVKRHDFADICVALQENGKMKDSETGYELEPTVELLAAQAFFFFVAGVDPCATALFATMVELAKHPHILEKVHKEIDETFEKCDGKLSYDTITDMEYLDQVLNEGMRIHPPIGILIKKCIQDSVLPVGNIKVEKGTKILTPIYQVHMDPKHYPNPEVFDPERFANGNRHGNDVTYFPFGKGVRVCIGMRYARVQVKAILVHVLRHFTVIPKINKGGIKYGKEQVQLRLKNVDVEFIPRNICATN